MRVNVQIMLKYTSHIRYRLQYMKYDKWQLVYWLSDGVN